MVDVLDRDMDMDFGVLGPIALLARGDAYGSRVDDSLTAPKLRGLLALLLCTPGPLPAAQVRDLLDDADRWRGGTGPMYVAIHRLRRWLRDHGGYALELRPGGYQLDIDADRIDAGRFRRLTGQARETTDPAIRCEILAGALALWRGPLAADAPPAVRQRYPARQLERLRRQATADLVAACLAAGTPARALAPIEELATVAPLDELVQAQHALALAACGLQAEALDVIERTRRTLAVELGIDPGSHLREAHVRILRQELAPTRP
jgi:DNA-binding SARP family transcriptional activator